MTPMIGAETARGYNMCLISGEPFFPKAPDPDEIFIDDIAHSLAMQVRFNGHMIEFYSVAQHSVLVSKLVPPEFALEGLLHDATEAYIGDMIRPLKAHIPGFAEIETRVDAAVRDAFDLPSTPSAEIKIADNIAAATERRDLLPETINVSWGPMPEPHSETIIALDWRAARDEFLARFMELTDE